MWGISPRNKLKNIHFQGESLTTKYSLEELWLRSDVVRLTNIFKIATPDKVELEGTKAENNAFWLRINKLENQNSLQSRELKLRWKQVE